MAPDDEVWAIEESLWTGGRAAYEGAVSPDAVFAFPSGLMAGNGFVAGLPDEGGWRSVEMDERHEGSPMADLRVLAYAAVGTRHDGSTYRALCSSTYARTGGRWRLAQHAQVPGPDEADESE